MLAWYYLKFLTTWNISKLLSSFSSFPSSLKFRKKTKNYTSLITINLFYKHLNITWILLELNSWNSYLQFKAFLAVPSTSSVFLPLMDFLFREKLYSLYINTFRNSELILGVVAIRYGREYFSAFKIFGKYLK